ncbi:hypothetical protein [Pseudoalteromonas sp. RB2-MNA-CIBAN-0110]|uniref:hypothetical protein n=1 Tax=Pseudoalteromonas sp. RB2-MNA-CIBAN-0110 TaxID=3140439 RepID=UPI003333EB83
MNNNKYFMAVPNDIMNTKNPLHYELLNFDTNIKLKLFIALLAKSTMIYKKNKKKGIQIFSIKGFLSDNSFIPRKSLNQTKLLEIINDFNSPFFDILTLNDKEISFELSAKYIKTLKSGFTNLNLMELKKHKDLKTTKLAILTSIYPSTPNNPKPYFSLNYLLKYLDVTKKLPRTAKIKQIKQAFSKLENIKFEYKHPISKSAEELPEHYKFHYETINVEVEKTDKIIEKTEPLKKPWELSEQEINDVEIKKVSDIEIDNTFDVSDLDEILEEHQEPISKIGHTDYKRYI